MRPTSKGRPLKRNHTDQYPAPITISPPYSTGFDGEVSSATTMVSSVALRRSQYMDTRRSRGRMKSKVSFLILNFHLRIPRKLPQVTIGVLKVAGVTAPERVLCGLGDSRACLFCLLHDRINFLFTVHIMADGKFGGTFRTFRNLCIIRNVVSRPNCEFQTGEQIEEGNGAMLKFSPHNPLRRQAKPAPVECKRPFQIVHAKGENCDSWFHCFSSKSFHKVQSMQSIGVAWRQLESEDLSSGAGAGNTLRGLCLPAGSTCFQ